MNSNVGKAFFSKLSDRIDMKIALRSGIGAGLALFVGQYMSLYLQRPNPIISSLWTCITTILVLQAHLGGTYRASANRFLGLAIGTVMGGAMTAWVGSDPITLGISVFLTIIFCALVKIQDSFRIASATVAVIMIVWQINPQVSPWAFSLYRFIDSCFGILIGVIVAHTIFPLHARQKLQLNMSIAMENLAALYRLSTSVDEPDEEEKKRILALIKKIDDNFHDNRQIIEDSKVELATKSARVEDWVVLLSQMDELFDQILSMRHVYKPNIRKLFDESLKSHFRELIDNINISFDAVTRIMKTGKWDSNLPDLDVSLAKLKDELLRFRGTKSTRGFGLEDVELFFVLFYNLKTLLELLKRIENRMQLLLNENSL